MFYFFISFIIINFEKKLTMKEQYAIKEAEEFLLSVSPVFPVLRKSLNSIEIKVANRLVKEGKLEKGISDDKHKNVIFYVDCLKYNPKF